MNSIALIGDEFIITTETHISRRDVLLELDDNPDDPDMAAQQLCWNWGITKSQAIDLIEEVSNDYANTRNVEA